MVFPMPSTDTAHPALGSFLQLAVPLEMQRMTDMAPEQTIATARAAAQIIAEHGDGLLYRTAHSQDAAIALAGGLAALALLAPGGVTAFGHHWCTDHTTCEHAAAHAAHAT